MLKRILAVGLVVTFVGSMLVGCARVTAIIISPSSAILEGGGSVTFTATDQQGNPVSVTWSVASGPGTITAAGVYTAPATVTEVTNATVTASLVSNPAVTDSATVTLKPPIEAELVDALGDGIVWVPGTYDVISIRTSRTSTTLTVTVTFDPVTTPTIPAPGAACDTAGYYCSFIDFDADEDPSTGIPSANSFYCPAGPLSATGVDYFIDLFGRNAAGNYDIIETTGLTDVGDASPSVAGNVLTLTIPLTELGGDDGATDVSSLEAIGLGGGFTGLTDCLPDEGGAVATGIAGPGDGTNPYADYLLNRYGIVLQVQTPSSSL